MKLSLKNMFTDKKPEDFSTVEYLVAMLKAYGIKNIVASPGTKNANFNFMIQEDDFFTATSIIDERSAAYVATGIAYETNEPVVITCTGATASRNWLSALTEAYYRKIPIIALSFYANTYNNFSLSAQYVDRSVSQNDIKYMSLELPEIKDKRDLEKALTYINAALSASKYYGLPVHINCPETTKLTDFKDFSKNIWKTEFYFEDFVKEKEYLRNKKLGIFIGAHKKFSEKEIKAISEFAESYDAPVFCDHTSQYTGSNKILISQACAITDAPKLLDLVIDLRGITPEYHFAKIFKQKEIWNISTDNTFKNRLNLPVNKIFVCSESEFFNSMKNDNAEKNGIYAEIKNKIENSEAIEIPFSNPYICRKLSKKLPKNSSLHLAILNSLRSMNYYNLDESITVNANVGGFGIDGALSTMLGQSIAAPNKKIFGLLGDLAFIYDMNALAYRNIKNNLRILLVNNGLGVEFKFNAKREEIYKEKTNVLVAAEGHAKNGAKAWAESSGFHYISARNKEDFDKLIDDFCNKEYDKPVLFECFTKVEDEQYSFAKLGLC